MQHCPAAHLLHVSRPLVLAPASPSRQRHLHVHVAEWGQRKVGTPPGKLAVQVAGQVQGHQGRQAPEAGHIWQQVGDVTCRGRGGRKLVTLSGWPPRDKLRPLGNTGRHKSIVNGKRMGAELLIAAWIRVESRAEALTNVPPKLPQPLQAAQ
jgi:hypothetical protein